MLDTARRRHYEAAVAAIRTGLSSATTSTCQVLEAVATIDARRLYAVRGHETFREWAESDACPLEADVAVRMARVYQERVVEDGEDVAAVVRFGWRRAWYAAADDRLRRRGRALSPSGVKAERRTIAELESAGVPASVERQNARSAAIGGGRRHQHTAHVVIRAGVRVWTRSESPDAEELVEAALARLCAMGLVDVEVELDVDANGEER